MLLLLHDWGAHVEYGGDEQRSWRPGGLPWRPVLSRAANSEYLKYPYAIIPVDSNDILRNENACVAEEHAVVLYLDAEPVNVPPTGVARFWPDPQGRYAVRNTVENGLRPNCVRDLFHLEWPGRDIRRWFQGMSLGFKAAKAALLVLDPASGTYTLAPGVEPDDVFEFDYSKLPGKEHALVILREEFDDRFQGYIWDTRDYDPAHPTRFHPQQQREDPAKRTDLNLPLILAEARRRGYPDIHYIEEMADNGFDNRALNQRDLVLCAPYKGMFTAFKFLFLMNKNVEKRAFRPARLAGPYWFVPFIPCYLSPRNVAERAADDKLRVTSDMGAPRNLDARGRPMVNAPANTPGALSVNANLRLDTYQAFPHLEFLLLHKFMQHVAVLASIRALCHGDVPPELEICKMKADYAAFYETLGRHPRCDCQQVQMVEEFIDVDERLLFGGADCPAECNRFVFFLTWLQAARCREEIQKLDLQRLLPPRAYAILQQWRGVRAEHGLVTDLFTLAAFFDDTGVYHFAFIDALVRRVAKQLWLDCQLEVVDGADGRKSKVEYFQERDPMEFLGIKTDTVTCVASVADAKCTRYSASALLLQETAAHSTRRQVPLQDVVRLEGQLTFAASTAPGLKGDLVCLRSVVSTGHAIHVLRQQAHDRLPLKSMKATLSKDAAERIRCLTARLASVPGSAFFPRCRTLGSQRGIMYIWTDASGDKDCGARAFRGWGGMIFFWPLPVVIIVQDLITYNARSKLQDSTAFELFALNEILCVAAPLLFEMPNMDVVQITDSTAARDIATLCRPHGTFERILLQQRLQLRRLLPASVQVVCRSVLRTENKETDLMSRLDLGVPSDSLVPLLRPLLRERLGGDPTIISVEPPRGARERMTLCTRAHDHGTFPEEWRMRDSYTLAHLRRYSASGQLRAGQRGAHGERGDDRGDPSRQAGRHP